MDADEAGAAPVEDAAAETLRPLYAIGMEVPVPERTRPAAMPEATPWKPYYGVRFSTRTRWLISGVLVGPALFVLLMAAKALLAAGALRAGAIVLLFPLVIAAPLLWMALGDLWRPRR